MGRADSDWETEIVGVILRAVSGPGVGLQFFIRGGQNARIGRTEWADFSVPGDGAMSDVHFAIACGPRGGRLQALGPVATLVNGTAVSETGLRTGDRVTAGATTFAVQVEGEAEEPEPNAAEPTAGPQPPAAVASEVGSGPTAGTYCRNLELSDDARPLLDPDMPPEQYLDRLVARELFPDALRFVAAWLPKPEAVRWACDCVQRLLGAQLTPGEQRAFAAAVDWAAEPSEEHRRRAEHAAEANQYNGPASWLALGAFWSGGSLAPPDLPAAPPPEGLTAQALAAALVLAAARADPRRINDLCRGFLQPGRERALAQKGTTS